MPLRRGLRTPLALAATLLVALAHGQATFTIGLDQTARGVVPTTATAHIYLLDLPTGVASVTIEVRGEDRDADLAVFFGDEELHYDIGVDPNPTYTLASPRAGQYRIEVLNLLWQELPYTIRVSGGRVAPTRPTPPGGGAAVLELGAGAVAPGSSIVVRYQGAPGNPRDWIGLYARGADDRAVVSWQYLEATRAGQRTVAAPHVVGAYEFRMFENDGFDRLAMSAPFDVEVAAGPGGGPGSAPGPAAPGLALTCQANAQGDVLGDLVEGARATVACPANCSASASVWGTDVYTDDSNVCAAAAHAGAIHLDRGGSFVVTILPGGSSYVGSARHGVTSRPRA